MFYLIINNKEKNRLQKLLLPSLQGRGMGVGLFLLFLCFGIGARAGNDVVHQLSDLSNEKSYTIRCDRGALLTSDDHLASTAHGTLTGAEAGEFAIISYEDNYYLYSVAEGKFVTFDLSQTVEGARGPLADMPTHGTDDAIKMDPKTDPYFLTYFTVGGTNYGLNTNGKDPYGYVINTWMNADQGNQYYFNEAGEFDPTEALAALDAYFHPAQDVLEREIANAEALAEEAQNPEAYDQEAIAEALATLQEAIETAKGKLGTTDDEMRAAAETLKEAEEAFIRVLTGDNVVTIGTASGTPGDEVTVSVSMTNTDAVAALQVSIPLNEELSFVTGSATLGGRSNGHSVTAGVKDGELNIMVYNMSLAAFTDNEGEVVSFRLKLGNQPTDIALTASKLILTDTNGNAVAGSTESGSVSIRCAKAQYSTTTVDFGSVPIRSTYHQTLTVTNIGNEPLVVTGLQFNTYPTDFSSMTTFPLTINAGGSQSIDITYTPQERGTVNETVKVLCNSISKLNNITLKAQPFAVNELHIQPASGLSDEVVTVAMTMNNMDAISGFQIEFTPPSQLEYVANSFTLSDRKADHIVVQSQTNGVVKIICYSPNDTPFTGEDGELASIQFKISGRNSTSLKASKCLLTATIKDQVTNVCSADYGATITVMSPCISVSSTLNMGAIPITQDAEKGLMVSNYGNAPLIINRVLFDKDGFSINEELPLTIAANSTKTLTVVYPCIEEGDYSTTMQIYSNDPEQRLWNVSVTGNRFAPNYLSFSANDVLSTQDVSVDVAMSNYDAINGLQFDVEYPSAYYEPTDELITTARAAGFSVSQRSINSNVVRYFFYSLNDTEIAPSEGKILTFKLHAKGETPEGGYTLNITNIKLGTADMVNKYAGTDLTCTFNVVAYLKGDANHDGEVDVADIIAIANFILGTTPAVFDRLAADVNIDGEIDVADIIGIANIILGGQASSSKTVIMNGPETVFIDPQ